MIIILLRMRMVLLIMRSNRYMSYVGVYETSRSELLIILNFSIKMRYIAGVQTGVLDMVRTSSVFPTHLLPGASALGKLTDMMANH